MRKRGLLLLSIFLFIVSGLLIVNSVKNMTGYSVLDVYKPFTAYLGAFVLFLGVMAYVLALMAGERESKKESFLEEVDVGERLKLIEQGYVAGIFDAIEAANELNKVTELQGIKYKHQTQLTVRDANRIYSLQQKSDDDWAIAIYDRILANNPIYRRHCQLHISKKASTKHHRDGLK